MAKFQFGNTEQAKNWSPERRQKAYQSFCAHIADGYCQESWYYTCEDGSLTWRTMLTWMQQNPHEFHPEHKEAAYSHAMKPWEDVVYTSATGDNQKANTASLQMVMRNKFGWDKPKHEIQISQESTDNLKAFEKLVTDQRDKV